MKRLTAKIKRESKTVAELEYDEAKLFRTVFSGTAGEACLDIILNRLCRIHEPLYVDNNLTHTVYNIGKRDVGMLIARLVYADEPTIPTVRREKEHER